MTIVNEMTIVIEFSVFFLFYFSVVVCVNATNDENTEVYESCSATLKGYHYVIGGRMRSRQV